MEIYRNIFLNTDKIIANTCVKVTYAGKLFQDGAQNVFIHYGYGEKWDFAQDIQMVKTELGFQADIYIENNSDLNLCFKTDYDAWDNNDGQNYSFKIENVDFGIKEEIDQNNFEAEDSNVEEISSEQTPEKIEQEENKSLCNIAPSWKELIKKTFNNFIGYISRIFSGKKEKANDNIK